MQKRRPFEAHLIRLVLLASLPLLLLLLWMMVLANISIWLILLTGLSTASQWLSLVAIVG